VPVLHTDHDVAIVGDETGVNVVRSTADAQRPLLRGGIFRQPQ
jgi:hypothetical protein